LPKGATSAGSGGTNEEGEAEGLRKSLLSIGVDAKSAEKLLSSRSLERLVVPVYWKDGLTLQAHPLSLSKLPNFLRSFQKEFPEGQVRWDPDYDEQTPQGESSRVAIRVYFDYQEDDQGHHWSPKPTEIEQQSYQMMLKRFSYAGTGALQASAVIYGR
jgi:hypothetical protein